MTDAQQASEAARELARARWGGQVARRAVETLRERWDELDADLREELAELAAIGARDPREREHG